ncbi:Annulin [Portunus trituberculatus]|uniref:Annulin n=1 Tax=Portunus trituberculatus TaxID=210409 RepID=A0A5B7HNL5_PORTR|nr:Annulin [Portunus trituberculatus]
MAVSHGSMVWCTRGCFTFLGCTVHSASRDQELLQKLHHQCCPCFAVLGRGRTLRTLSGKLVLIDVCHQLLTDTHPAFLSPSLTRILLVKKWGLQVKENGSAHHTDQFHAMKGEKPSLVVRRGQPFTLVLHTSQAYKEEAHKISLVFSVKGKRRR